MKQELLKKFNEQINFEMTSAYLYLEMSLHMDDANFKGYSNWLFLQYKEEFDHAEQFIDYLQKRGIRPELQVIEKPSLSAKTPLEIAKAVLEHEKKVSSAIYELHDIARDTKDYSAELFLHGFIEEQTEEEENALDIIDRFTFAADDIATQFAVDCQLGQREE